MEKLELQGTATKGLKILIADLDTNRLAQIETRAALEPALQRVDIYVTSSLAEATDLARRHNINVAIFTDGLANRDFVGLQLEMRRANPRMDLIPLVQQPSLQQYRASMLAGNVVDFEKPTLLSDWQATCDLILGYIDQHLEKRLESDSMLAFSEQLRRAICASHPSFMPMKERSGILATSMSRFYDLSTNECAMLFAAERIYFPHLKQETYQYILATDTYALLQPLRDTATWEAPETKPASVTGLIITAANYIAHRSCAGDSTDAIIQTFTSRPSFLKHQAIRVLTPQILTEVIVAVADFGGGKAKAYG